MFVSTVFIICLVILGFGYYFQGKEITRLKSELTEYNKARIVSVRRMKQNETLTYYAIQRFKDNMFYGEEGRYVEYKNHSFLFNNRIDAEAYAKRLGYSIIEVNPEVMRRVELALRSGTKTFDDLKLYLFDIDSNVLTMALEEMRNQGFIFTGTVKGAGWYLNPGT